MVRRMETMPARSVAKVLLSVLNHSVKCDENNIRGMAMGTVRFINQFCMPAKSSASWPGAFISPEKDIMIPTAYASITVPIFEKKRECWYRYIISRGAAM